MRNCTCVVYGLVQGIGYRPFVAELAEELHLGGSVRNAGGIVMIEVSGEDGAVAAFIRRLKDDAPAGARVDRVEVTDRKENFPLPFRIVTSSDHGESLRLLPPDLPVCPNCARDLLDSANRRYRYPFISCAACGPRFSIMEAVPYDRERTTMKKFPMCPACAKEYTEKGNIRRYAQTISCHDCGPVLEYLDRDSEGTHLKGEQALQRGISELKKGRIGAVRDIGGFHFAFLPTLSEPAMRLRIFKHREAKPFAVMFPDVDSIRTYCEVSPKEEELLRSPARPIVLLTKKIGPDRKPIRDFAPEVCGSSDRIGAMLPCSPLQILLLQETGPLVMTSGNRGGEPILTDEKPMEKLLHEGGPDFILTHDRDIVTPLEDSVYQVVEVHLQSGEKQEIVQTMRRGRGVVPEPIFLSHVLSQETFAAGGDLKNVFALGKGNAVYLSAPFGDLEELEAFHQRARAVDHMKNLLNIRPQRGVADRHPQYLSVKAAKEYFDKKDAGSYISVQHHYAHIASVIAEHGLQGPVIGVAFDGTGYGDDGTIWGSEFLLCDPDEDLTISYKADPVKQEIGHVIPMNDLAEEEEEKKKKTEKIVRKGRYLRMGHLMPVKMLGGDDSVKNAARSFNCYMKDAEDRQLIWEHYSEDEILDPNMHQLIEIAIAAGINTYTTTSMGRLFDAASAVLGICSYNTYEGECAQKLETAAIRAERKWKAGVYTKDNPLNGRYPVRFILQKENDEWNADGARLIGDLRMALDGGVPVDELALEFHDAIAEMVVTIVEKIAWEAGENGIQARQVALGGGTFFNRVLLQRIVSKLEAKNFAVYVNEKVPSGDGGLALGQIYLADKEVLPADETEIEKQEKLEKEAK